MPLAAGEPRTLLSDVGVGPLGQTSHHLLELGLRHGGPQQRTVDRVRLLVESDVLGKGAIQQVHVLGDVADVGLPRALLPDVSRPSTITRPSRGSCSPRMTSTRVVFPAPLPPTSATEQPCSTAMLTDCNASVVPEGYRNRTSSTRSTSWKGIFGSCGSGVTSTSPVGHDLGVDELQERGAELDPADASEQTRDGGQDSETGSNEEGEHPDVLGCGAGPVGEHVCQNDEADGQDEDDLEQVPREPSQHLPDPHSPSPAHRLALVPANEVVLGAAQLQFLDAT